MTAPSLPVPPGFALVVTGSLSAKEADRVHTIDQIRPVQVIRQGGSSIVNSFTGAGPLGVSAFGFVDDEFAVYSTGGDLMRLDLGDGSRRTVPVAGLVDVHEITVVGRKVLLANTGADEVVVIDADSEVEVERIELGTYRDGEAPRADEEVVDRFHVNQAFLDPSGERWALVHHVTGRQLLQRVARKVLKSQGDGGVINLDRRALHPLGLTAPHTVRRVGDGWWVFDSGKAEIACFDDRWTPMGTIPTGGWGRGADLSPDGRLLFAGMSPIRKRYRSQFRQGSCTAPTIEVYETSSKERIASLALEGIEQINNVYLVTDAVAEGLVVSQ